MEKIVLIAHASSNKYGIRICLNKRVWLECSVCQVVKSKTEGHGPTLEEAHSIMLSLNLTLKILSKKTKIQYWEIHVPSTVTVAIVQTLQV